MDVYLIRHGMTAGNLEKRYLGVTDEPLTKEAVSQLRRTRRCYPVPEHVVTSPMKRCRETASLLFPGIDSEVEEGLRECDFGSFEYKNYQELNGDPYYQRWLDSGGTLPFPGGESQQSFQDRSCEAFERSIREMADRGYASVAYVVHGGTIMSVMERFCGTRNSYFDWQIKNGEGFALQLDADLISGMCERSGSGESVRLFEPNGSSGSGEAVRLFEPSGSSTAGEADEAVKNCEPGRFLVLRDRLPLPAEQLHRSGIEDVCVMQKNKRLQCGYTTGSCAAAAARAAAQMLFERTLCREVQLMTPKGVSLMLETEFPRLEEDAASCAVRKYGGDDPDATDGLLIFAQVEKRDNCVNAPRLTGAAVEDRTAASEQPGVNATHAGTVATDEHGRQARVEIDGGAGVGRVTRPGLEQPVGAAAINRVPRQMIAENVQEVCRQFGYSGTIRVTVSVQGGEEVAKRTFNPHLGIVGGISILGTSGIVVPMSEQALIESIRVEMRQKVENGEQYLLITPGNYGADFLREHAQYEVLRPESAMKCSNYVGETLDMAVELGVKGILFVAHVGKFVKVSGGIMNTHSAHADCRAELMAAQAMRAGADQATALRLLASNTTEEAIGILKETPYLAGAIREMAGRIRFHLQKRCAGELWTEAVLFSSQYGYLGETEGAEKLIQRIARERRALARKETDER